MKHGEAANASPPLVSVLYAEISGRQQLSGRVSETEATHALDRCFSRMDRAISSFNGHVVKHMGDRLMATFNTPEEALRAACEMQLRVEKIPHVSGVRLSVGIAFHHGPMDEGGHESTGDAVKVASRLSKLTRPGQVLTTLLTMPFLSGNAQKSMVPLEMIHVKLHGHPIAACAIIWQEFLGGGEGERGELGEREVREVQDESKGQVASATLSNALTTASPHEPGTSEKDAPRLRLMHLNREYLLNPALSTFTLGRDPGSHVVIRNPHASRNHCQIEWRSHGFMLVDQSTNGTHVRTDAGGKLLLKGQEISLQGRGSFSFGLLSDHELDEDLVTYELMQPE